MSESPGVQTLSAVIQPYWYEGKQGKALSHEKVSVSKQLYLVGIAAQHFHIDIPQAYKLCNIAPPFSLVEKVEHQNCQHPGVVEIHHCNQPHKSTDNHRQYSHNYTSEYTLVPCFLIPVDKQERQQKAPQNILVYGVKQPAAQGKIEWNFRYNSENKNSL